MCGIIGSFNTQDDKAFVERGLEIIKNRGQDNKKILKIKNGYLGHNLLAIVGHVVQPIIGEFGSLVANCEIYNWKELKNKYKIECSNDAQLLLKLIEKKGIDKISEVLEELDGVYAFAYATGKEIILCRDIIGVKPLFYKFEGNGEFVFASEKKVIDKRGIELNPRKILTYSFENNNISFEEKKFFELAEEKPDLKKVRKLLVKAIKKRIPSKEIKVGVLFSGGIDSTVISKILIDEGYNITCYSAGFQDFGTKEPEDLVVSRQVAKDMNLKFKEKILGLKDVEKYSCEVIRVIEETDVVKVGVALPFAVCAKIAKEDGVKILFSGLGSEEIFAGYERHKTTTKSINEECVSGLLAMHDRDLYRDDVIMMNYGIELRLPFLDKELVSYVLRIDGSKKIVNGVEKTILRKVSKEIGVVDYVCERKKRAAQYGSRFDSALKKLAKRNGFKTRKEYLDNLE